MRRITLVLIITFIFLRAESQYNKGIIVEPILKTDTTAIGQKIVYPSFKDDEVTILKVTIPPGESTGWHKHPFPVFAYVLEGSLTVESENNKIILLTKNSSFPEVINTYHNGTNRGTENVVLIAFYMGEKGKPLSIRMDSINVK
jgi:quercetin dioxygenase-like cupin family protein